MITSRYLIKVTFYSITHKIAKIIGRYTDDVKNASMVINSYLRKGEFIVFDLDRPEDDALAIRLRYKVRYSIRFAIEFASKKKIKSEPANI